VKLLKTCSKCNLEKSEERFKKGTRQCKDCLNAYSRDLRKRNPEFAQKRRDEQRRWRERHPEEYKIRQRNSHLRRHWNMTQEEYEVMLSKQNGVCAICGKTEELNKGNTKGQISLAIDHDHETGKIRELLCMDCNQVLGRFNDDPDWFHKAAEYLIKHGKAVGNSEYK
jgi:hypothetical protein